MINLTLVRVLAISTERPDASAINRAGLITCVAFQNPGSDGEDLDAATYNDPIYESDKTGLYALNKIDLFNLLCIPPPIRGGDTDTSVFATALSICVEKRAMLIVDPPVSWGATPPSEFPSQITKLGLPDISLGNAALYFPRVIESDPIMGGQKDTFVPCGFIAGIISQTDAMQGVWKSPAGLTAILKGVLGLEKNLSDSEIGLLNPVGINCLRNTPGNGVVIWGARTMRGADVFADEYKYMAVRRVALYIEESLYRGTQWATVENNNTLLWAQIRLNVVAFMNILFLKGAFQGSTPNQAYFVKCDNETTTQTDIDNGILNIQIGFAPLKPSEFVLITIRKLAKRP